MKKLFFRIPRWLRVIMEMLFVAYSIFLVVVIFGGCLDGSLQNRIICDISWSTKVIFSLITNFYDLFTYDAKKEWGEPIGVGLLVVAIFLKLVIIFILSAFVWLFDRIIYPHCVNDNKKALGKKRK